MRDVTRVYYVIFGLLILIGGISAFVKVRSWPSLIAGGISGVLFFAAAIIMGNSLNGALIIGLLASISLAGKFVPDAMHKKAFFPGGLMAVLSVISITLTLISWYKE